MRRVIIAGGRKFTSETLLATELQHRYGSTPIEVVCGCARGADTLGAEWARARGYPVRDFAPDYTRYGKYLAPKYRNWQMAYYADDALIFWDTASTGSHHMAQCMTYLKKPCHLVTYHPGVFPVRMVPYEGVLSEATGLLDD